MLHIVLAREFVREKEREIARDLQRRQLIAAVEAPDRPRAAAEPTAMERHSTESTAVCVATPHRPVRAG